MILANQVDKITIPWYDFSERSEYNPPHIHAIYGDDMAAITMQTEWC